MRLDKAKIIWVALGIPLLIGSTLILSWSVLARHAGNVVVPWTSDAPGGRLGGLQVGSEPPDFSASDLAGRPITLSEFKNRKIVVLYFWATDCDLCVRKMPVLERLHHQFEEREVEILAMNVGEASDRVRRFSDREKYTFRMVADEDRTIGDLFGVGEIPALVVVDRDGRVMRVQVGESQSDELLRVLASLSEEPRSDDLAVAPPGGEDPRRDLGPAASSTEPRRTSLANDRSDVQTPRLLHKVEPTYTDEAREARIQGTVLLEGEVREDGKLHDIQVVESLDHGLDRKAIAAVEQWRFAPGQKDGRPARMTARIQVSFRLLENRSSQNL